jgi:hypothetical protein
LSLCEKVPRFARAYDHPSAYRTRNMVDQLMRWQDRFLFSRQYFHRSWEATERAGYLCLGAIRRNFRPYCAPSVNVPTAIVRRRGSMVFAIVIVGWRISGYPLKCVVTDNK